MLSFHDFALNLNNSYDKSGRNVFKEYHCITLQDASNVQFLVSDNGISQISSISFDCRQIVFFSKILHLVCPENK